MNRKQRNAAKMDYRQCRSVIAVECENYRKARWKENRVNRMRRIKKMLNYHIRGLTRIVNKANHLLKGFKAGIDIAKKLVDSGAVRFIPVTQGTPDAVTKEHFIDFKTQEQKA